MLTNFRLWSHCASNFGRTHHLPRLRADRNSTDFGHNCWHGPISVRYSILSLSICLQTKSILALGGILWVHHWTSRFRAWLMKMIKRCFRFICCCCRGRLFNCLRCTNSETAAPALPQQVRVKRKKGAAAQALPADNASDGGTFEGENVGRRAVSSSLA